MTSRSSSGRLGEAAVDGGKAGSGFFIGTTGGDESGTGRGAGGGQITEGAGEGFASDQGGGSGAEKVDSFHDGIGLENEIQLFGRRSENGAVVSGAVAKSGQPGRAESPSPAFDPEILAGKGRFHSAAARPSRSRAQVLALKKAWTRIAGTKLPLVR